MNQNDPLTDAQFAELKELIARTTPVGAVTASPGLLGMLVVEVERLRAAAPPADWAALRDRVAEALYRSDWPLKQVWAQALTQDRARYEAMADAVLAVLPEPTDRAAVLRDAAEICDETAAVYAEKGADDPASGVNTAASALFALMERFLRKADEAEYVATPCDSINPCEDGGEPCHIHERLMAHAEGEHELCEPDCGGHWPRRAAGETPATTPDAPREWCKCRSCWGWFVEEHPGEDLDELGRDLGWWSGLPVHRDAPAAVEARQDGVQQ